MNTTPLDARPRAVALKRLIEAPHRWLFLVGAANLLAAMVARLTQGHSGRALELGRRAGHAFILVQFAAVLRIGADFAADTLVWHVLAARTAFVAFVPSLARTAWIYLTPRVAGMGK